MKSLKPGTKYQSVSLAVPFIEEIKTHIKDSSQYRSVADFVRGAVREKMNQDRREQSSRKLDYVSKLSSEEKRQLRKKYGLKDSEEITTKEEVKKYFEDWDKAIKKEIAKEVTRQLKKEKSNK